MMEGMDNFWYNIEDDNIIIFCNVMLGKYIFKIKVCLKNGGWNEDNIVFLYIIVNFLFWRVWYVYLFYILLVLILIYFIFCLYKKRFLL